MVRIAERGIANNDGVFTVKGTVCDVEFTVARTVIYGGFHRGR